MSAATAVVQRRLSLAQPLTLLRLLGSIALVWGTGGLLFWHGLLSARDAWDEYKSRRDGDGEKRQPPDTVRQRMFDACRSGDVAALDAQLEQGGRLTDCEAGGYTPLLVATVSCQPRVVQHLLQLGANIEARNEGVGRTALHIAAQEGNEETLRVLLAAGAAVSSQDVRFLILSCSSTCS